MTGKNDGDRSAPPPAYSANENASFAGRFESQPVADVDITAAFSNLELEPNITERKLTVNTCLAHLKLLHACHSLKEEVGYSEGLFGLYDSYATDDANDLDLDIIHAQKGGKLEQVDRINLGLSKIREKRWALFVARAVDRYEAWWKTIQGPNSLTEDMMVDPVSDLYSYFPIISENPQGLREDMLPPLGIRPSNTCLEMSSLTLILLRCTDGLSLSHAQPTGIS